MAEDEMAKISFEIQTFLNVKNQVIKTLVYSYDKNTNEEVVRFIQFMKKKLNSKTFELSGIFIEAFYRNVTQNEVEDMNITIHNFLNEKIFNLSLSFNDDAKFFSELPPDSTLHTSFQFSTDSSRNYNLSVNYSTLKKNEKYWIEIPVEINKSKAVEFFDLRLHGLFSSLRDEFSRIIEIV